MSSAETDECELEENLRSALCGFFGVEQQEDAEDQVDFYTDDDEVGRRYAKAIIEKIQETKL